ncbi:MAG: hypothetical protein J2P24_11875 [Streptosporangiales bacterium]|nr:hypothetical protein [Streptosporangiales bacterium]
MTDLSGAETAALDAIDADALGRDLRELIAAPGVTGTAAESELQQKLAPRLEALGLDVDFWPLDLDALRADPAFPGGEALRDEAWGLAGSTAGSDGPHLLLQGTSTSYRQAIPRGGRATRSGHGRTATPFTDVCARDPWLRDHPASVSWPGGQLAGSSETPTPPSPGNPRRASGEHRTAATTAVRCRRRADAALRARRRAYRAQPT